MGKRLKEHLSSRYFEAANRLQSKASRRRIVAYVESYDDVFFWRTVLNRFEDDTRFFEVMLPSRISLAKGKKTVLMNLLSKQVGESMIACVDADYDYLLQGITPTSQKVVGNPYVFHTYAYAIENLQCYAPALHNLCVMATLNDHVVFDFPLFLARYSQAVFPLFVWNIWFYRQGRYGEFSMTDFHKVISPGIVELSQPQVCIERVRHKVSVRTARFWRHYPYARESYQALQQELHALGIAAEDTYLYIQGHYLLDNLVLPILKRVCNILQRERENEIYRNAVHRTQKENELASYLHSIEDVQQLLRKHTGYTQAAPFEQLMHDIAAFLAKPSV